MSAELRARVLAAAAAEASPTRAAINRRKLFLAMLAAASGIGGVAMATPIAHKGSTAGAKVQAMTALDFLLSPDLVKEAWVYFPTCKPKTSSTRR